MTALLTDEEIREEALAYDESCGPRMGTYSRVNAFIAGANLARSIYEARLAKDAKVREGLAEALTRLVRANEEWNSDVQQVIGRMPKWTDGYLDDARAALAAAKERG